MQAILNLLRLAVPMTLSRLCYFALTITDVMVVGRMIPEELAYQAAAVAPLSPPMLIGVGFLLAVTVLASQAHGEGDDVKAQRTFRLGVLYSLIIGLLCAGLALFPHAILGLLHPDADTVAGAVPIFRIIAISLLFQLIFTAPANFLEAINKPLIVMLIMISANLINIIANIWFVGGGLGLPAMGAVGSAWATLLIRITCCVLIFAWLFGGPIGRSYNLSLRRLFVLEGVNYRLFFFIGGASAFSLFLESSAFSSMVIIAGWISADAMAAFNIALNVLALIFMFSLGIGSAAAVMVGNAVGDKQWRDARHKGFVGIHFNSAFMLIAAIPCFFLATFITKQFTYAEHLIALAAPLIALSCVIMIFDGGQVIAALITRATGDSLTPTLLYFVCYTLIMIPLGYQLAIPMEFGIIGLYWAILIASIASVFLMSWRFYYLTRQKERKESARVS